MAYSITPTYEPITFQEMVAPNIIAKQEMDRQNDEYLKLLENMRSIDDLKNSQADIEDYNRYVDFKNRINSAVEDIAKNGLSKETARNLNKYKAEYLGEYANLTDKIKRRGDLIKEQREYQSKYPNSFFDIDYSTVPASKVTEGSSYTPYNMDVASESVASDIYNMFSAKGDSITDDDVNTIISGARGKYNYDNLSEDNKRKVDNAISRGIIAGNKAYSDAAAKKAYEAARLQKTQADAYKSMYGRYAGTGQSVRSGSGGGGSVKAGNNLVITLPGGVKVEATRKIDPSGNAYISYKGVDGKQHMISPDDMKGMSDEEITNYLIKENYGGELSEKYSGDKFGQDIMVYDDNGTLSVVNRENKLVTVNGTSDAAIYAAYNGMKLGDLPIFMREEVKPRYYNSDGVSNTSPSVRENVFNEKNTRADSIKNIKSYNDVESVIKDDKINNSLRNYVSEITGAATFEEGINDLISKGYYITVSKFYKNRKLDKYKGFSLELHREPKNRNVDNQQSGSNQNNTAPAKAQSDTTNIGDTVLD